MPRLPREAPAPGRPGGFEPVYRASYASGRLQAAVEEALAALESCRICPRDCDVNRLADETGICHIGRQAIVSSAFPHFGEEDCLRGSAGSGTIFFGLCNLKCVFCQNWDISQKQAGQALDAAGIAELMLALQRRGCHNINFVSPEHVVPQMLEAILVAAGRGLCLPIVYNTSGYDSLHSLRLLDGVIDIYMPDFKFWRASSAKRLAKAEDYPEVARRVIQAMHAQVGALQIGADGLARRGVLVRHLVMPGQLDESRAIFAFLAREVSPDTYINVMGQYRPEHKTRFYPEIHRRLRADELAAAFAGAAEAGLERLDARWSPQRS